MWKVLLLLLQIRDKKPRQRSGVFSHAHTDKEHRPDLNPESLAIEYTLNIRTILSQLSKYSF